MPLGVWIRRLWTACPAWVGVLGLVLSARVGLLSADEILVASGTRTSRLTGLATTPTPLSDSPMPEQVALAGSSAEVSEAEKITNLKNSIEADTKKVGELKSEMSNPRNEYLQAEAAFTMLDDALMKQKARLEEFTTNGKMVEAEKVLAEIDEIEKKRTLAKERFDLAIQTRKVEQEQIKALEDKISQDKAALLKLAGPELVPAAPSPTPVKTAIAEFLGQSTKAIPTTPPAAPVPMPAAVPPPEPAPATPPAAAPPQTPVPSSPTPAVPANDSSTPVISSPPTAASVDGKPVSKELVEAQQQAQIKKEAALEAEKDAESVVGRIKSLEKDIELETKLLTATRRRADLVYQAFQQLSADAEKLESDGAPAEKLREIRKERRQAEELFRKALAETTERTERLNELQTRRSQLQQEELAALDAAKTMQAESAKAEEEVRTLENPLSLVNLLHWLINHGPAVAVLLLAMLVGRIMVGLTSRRMVSLMTHRGDRGTKQEREDRARTLAGVFHNAGSTTVLVGGGLMIFEECGIAVAPLMGGAAVLGLAVAFGAQNLLRDYFYGFVILLENQYKLNDILQIGSTIGQVEQITLRMTVLRDQEGNVHFIPNGKIDSVTNMTHGWARVVVDVNVPDTVEMDDTMRALMETAQDLRLNPEFDEYILGDPEMLGVESLSDTAVVLRLTLKTRATHKQQIRRVLLRRIRDRLRVHDPGKIGGHPSGPPGVTLQEPPQELGHAA